VKSVFDRLVDDARAAANTLADNLRGSAGTLQTELDAIRGELSGVREGRLEDQPAGGRARPSAAGTPAISVDEPEAGEDTFDEGPVDAEPEVVDEVEETTAEAASANGDLETAVEEDEVTAEEEEADVAEEATAPQAAGGGRSIRGAEGARLIALNMALNGTPRDETARYLSQNFDLDDQDALLDEVYARVGD
jgi:hypothetical protein